MSSKTEAIQREEFMGHPKGLYILFFTEMWERFSYYGMRALLVLYMSSKVTEGTDSGLGWTSGEALAVYGWYTMLVYVMSIPGGIIADRWLGQKKTVLIGGILLCLGHGVLAIDAPWAFMTGLVLIILGVGGLKPNISTMVGGLYAPGDTRRDKGFTIFYMGINIGAFFSGITIGVVGTVYGWHYGFGMAGIGMLLGQIVFMMGKRHLVGVGDFVPTVKDTSGVKVKLTKIEKDRMIVLFLSFLIIVVFWGAFEQAGGLLNLYTDTKTDRMFMGWEIPTTVFQSLNPAYIILFGLPIAGFWVRWGRKGKQSSSLFKMAIGTIIMGLGFFVMSFASMEAGAEPYGKAGFYWLLLAYLLHTIGELCASPVSLSFITKLAPVKYASIMMGVYFAATGFGNKLAGIIGEASVVEPYAVEMTASVDEINAFTSYIASSDTLVAGDHTVSFRADIYPVDGGFAVINPTTGGDGMSVVSMDEENRKRVVEYLGAAEGISAESPYHATIELDKDPEMVKGDDNVAGDGKSYAGSIKIEEEENAKEFSIFTWIFVFTAAFGLLLILLLKKLKALTHGAEDVTEEDKV
jgi:POT family proton-dependent oligopeptide transporter